jgi:hypothetical protein
MLRENNSMCGKKTSRFSLRDPLQLVRPGRTVYCSASTDAYQRQSRDRRKFNEKPFTANCPQRLRGDQLFNALTAALGMPDGGRSVARSYFASESISPSPNSCKT